jgi:hypothetical protein
MCMMPSLSESENPTEHVHSVEGRRNLERATNGVAEIKMPP